MSYQSVIKVLAISSAKTFYDGPAYAVASENSLGPFQVLQGHVDFISIISKQLLIYKNEHETISIPLNRGVLSVKDNFVRIHIGL